MPIPTSPTPPRGPTAPDRRVLQHQAGAPRKRVVRAGPPPLSAGAVRIGAALLLLGAALTVGGIFPSYLGGSGSLAAQTARWLFVTIPLVAWVPGALLMTRARPAAVRMGTGLAFGSVWISSGLTAGGIGQLVATGFGPARAGFWLVVAGAGVAIVGVVIVLAALRRSRRSGAPVAGRRLLLAVTVIASAAAVVGYLPGWRVYRVTARTLKHADVVRFPGPFQAPWEVIVAEVAVVVGIGLLPLVAARWDDLRAGGAMILGVALGIGGLLALNLTDVLTAKPETLVPAAQVKSFDVRLSASLAWGFWVEAGALAALVLIALATMRPGRTPG